MIQVGKCQLTLLPQHVENIKPDWVPRGVDYHAENHSLLPEPYERISLETFLIGMWGTWWFPRYKERRGVKMPHLDYGMQAFIYWWNDHGIAVLHQSFIHIERFAEHLKNKTRREPASLAFQSPYGKDAHELEFYRIGCDHEYEGVSAEDCPKFGITSPNHIFDAIRCPKCGSIFVYDDNSNPTPASENIS